MLVPKEPGEMLDQASGELEHIHNAKYRSLFVWCPCPIKVIQYRTPCPACWIMDLSFKEHAQILRDIEESSEEWIEKLVIWAEYRAQSSSLPLKLNTLGPYEEY